MNIADSQERIRNNRMQLELIYYGHDTLKKTAREVTAINQELIDLIDGMYEVMRRAKGIGLAAPQVNVSSRVIILDIEAERDRRLAMELINPVIKEFSEREDPREEGCLSVPGIWREVIRPSELLVSAVTRDGKEIEFEASGLLARVIQHEIDHLNGVLFIDRLEDYIRNELRPDLKKIKKLNKK